MIAKANTKTPVTVRELIPAVGYIRMSSDRQDKSPEQQRAEIIKLAAKYGYRIIRWYEDHGISGDDIKRRVQFRAMIGDATAKGDFRAVLCWDQDRFGRFDSIDSGEWIAPLRRAGVKLVTSAQGIIDWESFGGRVIFNIQQEGKNQFLKDLSRNVVRAKLRLAQSGDHYGGRIPFGMDKLVYDENGVLQKRVGSEERFAKPKQWRQALAPSSDALARQTVAEIFDRYANTETSLLAIAEDLNQRKVRAARGTTWHRCTIKQILQNPAYVGDLVFGKTRQGKHYGVAAGEICSRGEIDALRGPKNSSKNSTPSEDRIVIADAHEGLIDRATFDRVQDKIKNRRRTRRHVRGRGFVLSGLVFCGHCGGSMNGKTTHRPLASGETNQQRYYCCTTRAGYGMKACENYSVSEQDLVDTIFSVLREQLLSDEVAARIVAEVAREASTADQPGNDSGAAAAQLAELQKKIDRGTENLLLADPEHMGLLQAKLSELRRAHAQVLATVNASATRGKRSAADVAEIKQEALAELQRLREGLGDEDPAVVQEIAHHMIDHIELWFTTSKKTERSRKAHTFARGMLTLAATGLLTVLENS